MKNLDIEKLERKNIYTTPNNFFENVQENVLQKTTFLLDKEKVATKTSKIIQINWWYAAAAAVVIMFGTLFFYNNKESEVPNIAQNKKQNMEPATTKTVAQIEPTENPNSNLISDENYNSPKSNLNSLEKNETKEIKKQQISIAKIEQPKKVSTQKSNTDEQVEMILASFSNEEIAAISKNTEQDVYLDLYN